MIAFLRKLFFDDFWLKLFSLVLAILTWLAVYFAIKKEVSPLAPLMPLDVRTFADLPVVVMSAAEDVRNFRVIPNQVAVTVQGDARTLQNLQNKDIRALVDLTGIQTASALKKRIEVSTPPGVTHVRVTPQEVQVIFPAKS